MKIPFVTNFGRPVIIKNKWFYPGLIAYLIFGIWFGSLNYNVGKSPNNYDYWTRFAFYPVSTTLQHGWLCKEQIPKSEESECVVGPSSLLVSSISERLLFPWQRLGVEPIYRASRIGALALFWPIKIVWSIISVIAIIMISVVVLLSALVLGIFRMFFFSVLYYGVGAIVEFINLLL
jgi:hypothetical protein